MASQNAHGGLAYAGGDAAAKMAGVRWQVSMVGGVKTVAEGNKRQNKALLSGM